MKDFIDFKEFFLLSSAQGIKVKSLKQLNRLEAAPKRTKTGSLSPHFQIRETQNLITQLMLQTVRSTNPNE